VWEKSRTVGPGAHAISLQPWVQWVRAVVPQLNTARIGLYTALKRKPALDYICIWIGPVSRRSVIAGAPSDIDGKVRPLYNRQSGFFLVLCFHCLGHGEGVARLSWIGLFCRILFGRWDLTPVSRPLTALEGSILISSWKVDCLEQWKFFRHLHCYPLHSRFKVKGSLCTLWQRFRSGLGPSLGPHQQTMWAVSGHSEGLNIISCLFIAGYGGSNYGGGYGGSSYGGYGGSNFGGGYGRYGPYFLPWMNPLAFPSSFSNYGYANQAPVYPSKPSLQSWFQPGSVT